jgi:hypothetical protein
VSSPRPPGIEPRRAPELSAELRERARAWIPSWALEDGERDFGRALLEIAARLSSEVAERLDRAGEKMQRGFLDWLAVRGKAARPARMPVVFKLADAATEAVLADAPVRMQVDAGGASVIFETEKDVRLIPGTLAVTVAVDAGADAVYLPPPGLSDLQPLEPLPVQWQLKSFAAVGATTLQVDPETGLAEGMVLEADGLQYRVVAVDKEIVTIDPPLTAELPAQTVVRKVAAFAPFDGKTRNSQEHALYLGHKDLFDIESAATISIDGAQTLRSGVAWEYWGKAGSAEEIAWRTLTLLEDGQKPGSAVFSKPQGAIEPRDVGGKNSRWIRAIAKSVPATQEPFQADELSIGINAPQKCGLSEPFPPVDELASVEAEGLANTTPLVLGDIFFPLGREPRQFDAFYLGSQEAFSKPGAEVQLNFQMADPSFESLAATRSGPLRHWMFAGVAGDGHLYILTLGLFSGQLSRHRGPLRPPSPGAGGVAVAGLPVPLDPPRPPYRTAVWPDGNDFLVAVAAGDSVWMWREVWSAPETSGWTSFGAVGPVTDSMSTISGIVHLDDGLKGQLFALRDGQLFVRDLNDTTPTWEPVPTKDGLTDVKLATIVPVVVESSGDVGPGTTDRGLTGVSVNEKLYAIDVKTNPGNCIELLSDITFEVLPAAAYTSGNRLLVVAAGTAPLDRRLFAWRSLPNSMNPDLPVDEEDLPVVGLIGKSIDVNINFSALTFALTAQDGPQSTALVLWTPYIAPLQSASINSIPNSVGLAGGSPTILPGHVIVPAISSQLLVAPFNVGGVKTFHSKLRAALIAVNAAGQLAVNDRVAIPYDDSGTTRYELETVTGPGVTSGGETLYEFDVDSVKGDVFVYRAATAPLTGTVDPSNLNRLILENSDTETEVGTILLIETDQSTKLYTVVAFVDLKVVHLDEALDVIDPTNPPLTVDYWIPETSAACHVPMMRLTSANNDWPASLLDHTFLTFPGADPEKQRGKAFEVAGDGKPIVVALGEHWTTPPTQTGLGAKFLVDGTVGEWTAQLGNTSSNPALSWEYANGTGWWKLDPIHDETLNLKQSGNVRFTVPNDLRPMDWAGRTNYWIRARLVGGDYGKEIVTVITKPTGNPGETQQTIERSSSGISAPSVVTLHIAYRLCKSTRPDFVLAQDSGSVRDQSDANRTRGAIVEAFVPLAVTLGRLNTVESRPPACPRAGEIPAEERPEASSTPARALFIGLDAIPSGAPVNVLLLVDQESGHEQFAPMKIGALSADRFIPIVADDTTRALGESGLVSMAFAIEPTRRELFGFENLTWLRLTPGGDAAHDDWTPSLRGAYLNAVFASAAETLTRELLGSSQGAPNLTVRLARPPVLQDSLELRVREPLGDEERQALREGDETRVLSDVEGLPGDWVLWDPVIDPGDEAPSARVYALDEASGEIRFGDGQHGMIPPIGLDSIVAFTYKRTEIGGSETGDVPGNAVVARAALNLVSPVESVEAVFAADRAAGGAPPESAERVVRCGTARLRHRSRAVTAHDFEDLALESSPDIVQARSFARDGGVRLIVVMRGEDPLPDAAEVRELRQLLLAAAPAALAAPGALRITGPRIRRLRVLLTLRVASLDHAGDVARDVQARVIALFDTATWALGASPSEEEIALALLDVAKLESLGEITLREVLPDGTERPWSTLSSRASSEGPGRADGAPNVPPTVQRDELVLLDEDAVRLAFETVEVIA